MNFIAHRGDQTRKEEENTLQAIKRAIENPEYVGFECDIRTSKDGVFILHHDIFLDGKLVNSYNYKELKEKYHITSLDEVLNLATSKIMLLEIKEPYLDVDALDYSLNKQKNKNIYVVSFDNNIIKECIKKDVPAKCGVFNYVLNSEKDYSEYDFIGILSPIVTDHLLSYFKEQNMEVFLYGMQNAKHLNDLDSVYYIIDSKMLK